MSITLTCRDPTLTCRDPTRTHIAVVALLFESFNMYLCWISNNTQQGRRSDIRAHRSAQSNMDTSSGLWPSRTPGAFAL